MKSDTDNCSLQAKQHHDPISTPTSVLPPALHSPKQDLRQPNVPSRQSSDTAKRAVQPSPLSKPSPLGNERKEPIKSVQKPPVSHPAQQQNSESPAAQQLAALNKKEDKKGKSRLRRAFSFGSAAELRRASAANNHNNNVADRNKLQKDQFASDEDAEQAAVAQKQEAAGLGESIYSGQGHFFTGSTDNLSISSTASSASVMIRKMGKGVKKSTRSLVGLFRPKSVVGVPAADSPVASVGQVSMVTVEAEREKVNVNADPHDQSKGGTGYPKLERNSVDAANSTKTRSDASRGSNDNVRGRKSIMGGESERAEVLAAVKKGILKRRSRRICSLFPI